MSRSIILTISTVALLFMPVTSTIASTKAKMAFTDGVIGSVGGAVAQNNPACKKRIRMKGMDVDENINASNLANLDLSVVNTERMCSADIDISNSKIRRKVVIKNGAKVSSTLIK